MTRWLRIAAAATVRGCSPPTPINDSGARPVLMLNLWTSDLEDQLDFLAYAKSVGALPPGAYVELGGEFYCEENRTHARTHWHAHVCADGGNNRAADCRCLCIACTVMQGASTPVGGLQVQTMGVRLCSGRKQSRRGFQPYRPSLSPAILMRTLSLRPRTAVSHASSRCVNS